MCVCVSVHRGIFWLKRKQEISFALGLSAYPPPMDVDLKSNCVTIWWCLVEALSVNAWHEQHEYLVGEPCRGKFAQKKNGV